MIWIYIGIGFMIINALWLLWEIKNAPLLDENGYQIEENDHENTH